MRFPISSLNMGSAVLAIVFGALGAMSPAASHQLSVSAGEKAWMQCRACHSIQRGAADKIGPNLHGIVGRPAAIRPGFAYSEALKASGLTWDRATLDRFIERPNSVLKGHRMVFMGMPDAKRRADLIDYLARAGE